MTKAENPYIYKAATTKCDIFAWNQNYSFD